MRSRNEVAELLDELEHVSAHELEAQDLDFKQWIARSMSDSINQLVEMAVCMANGGGGTVVFGVRNDVRGRQEAILGVPPEVDVTRLVAAVYARTDPKITPVFEELRVREGTGRILVMQIHPGLPPYTDTSGSGKIRVGTDCQPLTGSQRRRVMVETGETDFTAEAVCARSDAVLSASAFEQLRRIATQERADEALLARSNLELLTTLGMASERGLTRSALLIAGSEEAIRQHVPFYRWSYLRMTNETSYSDRIEGCDPIPVAVQTLLDRVMSENPIATLEYGAFHFEYRTYPEIALPEGLMNAFGHADDRLPGAVFVKHFPDRIEISNPGGFIGGISPENILHHPPIARNPQLLDGLNRLRLVNRSNLGIPRMFRALLEEERLRP